MHQSSVLDMFLVSGHLPCHQPRSLAPGEELGQQVTKPSMERKVGSSSAIN